MNASFYASILLLALGLPLGLAGLWVVPGLRGRIGSLVPWAPLPALALALFTTPGPAAGPTDPAAGPVVGPAVDLDWLLLGARFGLTETTQVFLLFSALLWLGAGIYARGYLRNDPHRPRFELLWLLTLSGNLGLILALDVVSFYAGFALMTFAGYGLVVHTATAEARRAGRVYLVLAVFGEGLLLAGLMLAASQTATPMLPLLAELPAAVAQTPQRDLIVALLWAGFGIKAGLPLLHVWLPLAHPVAPVPASAVLSGAMIKAGLLGWLHTLPLGLISLPGWGTLAITAGLLAAFGGVFIGLQQTRPKTVLAYSSISQMGLIGIGIGAGLRSPELWPLLGPAVTLYAFHHGLAKGALFLGVGIARHPGEIRGVARWLLWGLLALPAFSLAGLMTSGAMAKLALKEALGPGWPLALGLAAVATTLIMARYLWLLRLEDRGDPGSQTLFWGWGVVLAGSGVAVFAVGSWPAMGTADALALIWPVGLGVALALLGGRWLRPWSIPAGDVLALCEKGSGSEKGSNLFFPKINWTPFRTPLQRRGRRFVRPDRVWQRELRLTFAVVLVLVLVASLVRGPAGG